MTKEEAIAYITEWLKDEYALNDKDREVLTMALSTLEQEPCDDAVSREAVRQGMMKYGFTAPDMTVHEFVEDELPSVTQKSGKWLITSMSHIPYCSVCDYLFKDIPVSVTKYIKYCPNCEAKMVKPQESEE